MTTLFVVDVESDGPCPALYSMVSFAAVRVQRGPLDCTFYGEVAPVVDRHDRESLAVSGVTREQHLHFEPAQLVMPRFAAWLLANSDGAPKAVSDNPAFDWQFLNYYLHAFTGSNPLGHSARRIGDFYAGLERDFKAPSAGWRSLKRTKHTHHPVDDARGNAEAFIALDEQHHLNVPYPSAAFLAATSTQK